MKKLVALAVFHSAAILGWAGYHEYLRATAPTFRIPLQPQDPFDLFRGRYFILNPEDSQMRAGVFPSLLTVQEVQNYLQNKTDVSPNALIGFCASGETYRVCALRRPTMSRQGSPARFWSRGIVFVGNDSGHHFVHLDLKLDRFFIPNRAKLPAPESARGWELEVISRDAQTLLPRRLWFGGKPALDD